MESLTREQHPSDPLGRVGTNGLGAHSVEFTGGLYDREGEQVQDGGSQVALCQVL